MMPSATTHGPNGMTSTSPIAVKPTAKVLSRNIDEVVLGDVLFSTWYHSPYPDSLIFTTQSPDGSQTSNGSLANGFGKGHTSNAASWKSAICPRLHVCPYCFSYSPHAERYVMHLRHHQRLQKESPGLSPVPESAVKVYDHDGYAVYQIDGEKEKLYCQNLSLFGKLFLENKSVFFDTTGFEYHVLIYTTPSETSTPVRGRPGRKRGSSASNEDFGLSTQVLGFFSKEKMSWDANNLACILIFPPFQHRQLGKLLMSVSYKLSGWEWLGEPGCAIGGPEKPLSSMGRKSYLRFWSERIARYMMGQSGDSDGVKLFGQSERLDDGNAKKQKKKGKLGKEEEMTVKEIGERTGMLAEDVIAALTEMDVCQPPAIKKPKKKAAETNGDGPSQASEADREMIMLVRRSQVLEWANRNGVELEDPVRAECFIGEWATVDEEVDDDSDEVEEEG